MTKSIKCSSCVSSGSYPSHLAVSQAVKGENQETLKQKIISRSGLNLSILMSSDRGSYEIFDAVSLSSRIVFL